MFSSSHVRLTTAFSLLLLICVVGFALFGSTRLVSHAVDTSLKPFTKSSVKASCGAWSVVPSPNVAAYSNILYGITALSANNAWAVGYYINASSNIDQTLTEQWNGTGWNVVSSPNIGISGNRLSAIAHVPATTQVWVAGYYGGNSGYQTLIEFYC